MIESRSPDIQIALLFLSTRLAIWEGVKEEYSRGTFPCILHAMLVGSTCTVFISSVPHHDGLIPHVNIYRERIACAVTKCREQQVNKSREEQRKRLLCGSIDLEGT